YIHVPVVEMRQKPSLKSEVVSQALFSEQVASISENADWIKIETILDGYQGWIRKEAIHFRKTPYLAKPDRVAQIS
ncbi:SH3 domain-containing protein, partial [Staphylococcus aureus]